MGEHAAGAGPAVQGHRAPERGFSVADSAKLYRQGEAPCRGLFAGAGRGNDWRRRKISGAAGDPAHFGDDYWVHVVEMDSVVSRLAGFDESVEQRGALGTANETFSADVGVLLARRPYGARHA